MKCKIKTKNQGYPDKTREEWFNGIRILRLMMAILFFPAISKMNRLCMQFRMRLGI